MDESGLAIALEHASSTPPLDAHGVLVRRVRDLIDNDDLIQALSFITEVNKRMPGAPFADVARCLYHLEKNVDGRGLLLEDSTWLEGRRRDQIKAEYVRKFRSTNSMYELTETLTQLTVDRIDNDVATLQNDNDNPSDAPVVQMDHSTETLGPSKPVVDDSIQTFSVSAEGAPSDGIPAQSMSRWGSTATVIAMLIGVCLLAYAFFGF